MRVIVGSGNTLQMTCRHQFSGHDACTSLDTLSAIVGKLHLLFIELDTVTEYAEHSTRTHDIWVEAFLFQCVVLRKTSLVNQIHGFVHCVFDILVVGCKGEEVMVDFLYILAQMTVLQWFCISTRNESNKQDTF